MPVIDFLLASNPPFTALLVRLEHLLEEAPLSFSSSSTWCSMVNCFQHSFKLLLPEFPDTAPFPPACRQQLCSLSQPLSKFLCYPSRLSHASSRRCGCQICSFHALLSLRYGGHFFYLLLLYSLDFSLPLSQSNPSLESHVTVKDSLYYTCSVWFPS
jgi:hypothetical protein